MYKFSSVFSMAHKRLKFCGIRVVLLVTKVAVVVVVVVLSSDSSQ